MGSIIARYSASYVPVHGTKNGYDWHRRGMNEIPCHPCREAMKAYWVYQRTLKDRGRGLRPVEYGAKQEPYTLKQVINIYGTNCHICLDLIDMDAPRRVGWGGWEKGLHIDHVIPLSKGGDDTLENVRPSHGQCNIMKHTKILNSAGI